MVAQLVDVALDARALALEEGLRPHAKSADAASQCADSASTGIRPRKSLCSPCAPPSNTSRPRRSRTRSPGSSSIRSAAAARARSRPSSGRKAFCIGQEKGAGDRPALALGQHHREVLGQARADAQEELQAEVRARAVRRVGAAVAAVEEFPVAPLDRGALEPAQPHARLAGPGAAPGGCSCAARGSAAPRKSSKSA